MSESNKPKKWYHKLRYTYRLVFFNDHTFGEVWHLRITLINILSIVGIAALLLISGAIALVMFTPMREWVPGYPTQAVRIQLVENALRLDSLEYELELRDRYFQSLNAIISGKVPASDSAVSSGSIDRRTQISFSRSSDDSLLRRQVEETDQFNFVAHKNKDIALSQVHFFKPVNGVISSGFDPAKHFGIDVVSHPNEVVKSVLDGTVIFAAWTVETGYVVEVQHSFNLISVYKHCANLLKKAGDTVKAGDAIAIIGNSGELTTGPHLHLEIWQNGKPINPSDYIVF